jgi:hypothetical protein
MGIIYTKYIIPFFNFKRRKTKGKKNEKENSYV